MSVYETARRSIDQAHSADPKRNASGLPAELDYADRMEAWVERLVPNAPILLRLAARCQHLERWSVPRDSYPMDKPGYHAWRKFLYVKQAERAKGIALQSGIPEAEATDLFTWVSKTGLKTIAGTQALEDAACLVFLEQEISSFAQQHANYPREKFTDILRKTWKKMSPNAQVFAWGLNLTPEISALIREATSTVQSGGA